MFKTLNLENLDLDLIKIHKNIILNTNIFYFKLHIIKQLDESIDFGYLGLAVMNSKHN